MEYGRGGLIAFIVAMALLLPGCSDAGMEQAESPGVDVGTAPRSVAARETTHAPVAYREFELPSGGSVEGYTEQVACLREPVSDEVDLQRVRVLDLDTGDNRVVVPQAVGADSGYDILSARCSDTWLVWEEISGDEQERPLGVQWRLYAVALDGIETRGAPMLVAGTVTSAQSRPLYSVCDDAVYWMTNSFANAEQEGSVDVARVWSRTLPEGDETLLYSTPAGAFTFSAQPGELLLTEALTRVGDEGKLVVLDPDTGAVQNEIYLKNESWLSHFSAYRDGMAAWSVGNADGGAGNFFFRDVNGTVNLVSTVANDAVFVGRYLVYESKPNVTSGTSTRAEHWRVCALDTETLEYFTVFDEEARAFGWSAPLAVAPTNGIYLMSRAVPPWITEEPFGTWVRVYTLP